MEEENCFVEKKVDEQIHQNILGGVVKFGTGLFLGSLFSLLFFKRKKWPVVLGGGFGIGMANK
ncbi:unnamed protein product [Brassicogethes aeneus]|uniref:MICOS complex subunit MIC10 n=1 Tax=Brassicogethes aeneus TaxID=1431903 RepID=A0A9P0FGS5_BRAAE|nr:unnamed protein product [Brassicogethes aeneus]